MGAQEIREVTAEGTNAGGDETRAAGADGIGAAGVVAGLVSRGRAAMEEVAGYDQDRVNEVVQAASWAIIKQENAEELARLAVEDTGLGRFEDKVRKNQRKTLGTLRDLLDPGAGSVGVIRVDEAKGITEIAKPVGVVGAVTPSTNGPGEPAGRGSGMRVIQTLPSVVRGGPPIAADLTPSGPIADHCSLPGPEGRSERHPRPSEPRRPGAEPGTPTGGSP